MKHLESIKVDHKDVVNIMDEVDGLNKILINYEKKKIPEAQDQVRHLISRRNRLEMMINGKISEIFESLQIIYNIKEPPEGYQLQFDFTRHLIRLIKTPRHGQAVVNDPFGQMQGEEWKNAEGEIDESEVDWDNPKHVKIYNQQRAEKWKEIRKLRDDGIDWEKPRGEETDDGDLVDWDKPKRKSDDDDDTEDPTPQKV